jgi:hypothetical protein
VEAARRGSHQQRQQLRRLRQARQCDPLLLLKLSTAGFVMLLCVWLLLLLGVLAVQLLQGLQDSRLSCFSAATQVNEC